MDAIREVARPSREAWDNERRRHGDHIDLGDEEKKEDRHHRNFWSVASVLRAAWQQVGSVKTMRKGVDGLHRELSVLSTCSSAAWELQRRWVADVAADVRRNQRCVAVFQYYDATPRQMWFGRCQRFLTDCARYPVLEDGKWKTYRLDDYLKLCPGGRRVVNKGTLEFFASAVEIRQMQQDGTHRGARIIARPQILERSNASCIYAALEATSMDFAIDRLPAIASRVPFILVGEAPDACRANIKKQLFTSHQLRPIANAVHSRSKCGAHQACRVIAATEGRSIGDVHACCVACGHVSHAER